METVPETSCKETVLHFSRLKNWRGSWTHVVLVYAVTNIYLNKSLPCELCHQQAWQEERTFLWAHECNISSCLKWRWRWCTADFTVLCSFRDAMQSHRQNLSPLPTLGMFQDSLTHKRLLRILYFYIRFSLSSSSETFILLSELSFPHTCVICI